MINTGNKVKPSQRGAEDEEDDFEREEVAQIDDVTRDNQGSNQSIRKRQPKKHEESGGEKFYRSLQPNSPIAVPEQLFATCELARLNNE